MNALRSPIQLNKNSKQSSVPPERLLLPHMPIQFDQPYSAIRRSVEQFIADSFHNSYQANITVFSPYLLSTHSDNTLTATIGFQPAITKHPLFLEQYLSTNIETTLSKLLNQTIQRDQIVEVGNLASSQRGWSSQVLFILSVAILHRAGFKWVTFTATKQVQRLLKKLKLTTQPVCQANPVYLIDQGESWGSYYNEIPNVLVGNLADAVAQLTSHKVIKFILDSYHHTIIEISDQIRIKS